MSETALTSPNRFASGCTFTKSLMFPFAIQSDTIANWVSDVVIAMSGRTFGCRSVFHVTTSLQKLYVVRSQGTGMQGEGITSNSHQTTFCKSLFEYVLMTFTVTSHPQYTPLHTSANPPLYNATSVRSYKAVTFMEFGRRAWRPHVLYNDLMHFFRIRGERSRVSSAWMAKHDVKINQRIHNHGQA